MTGRKQQRQRSCCLRPQPGAGGRDAWRPCLAIVSACQKPRAVSWLTSCTGAGERTAESFIDVASLAGRGVYKPARIKREVIHQQSRLAISPNGLKLLKKRCIHQAGLLEDVQGMQACLSQLGPRWPHPGARRRLLAAAALPLPDLTKQVWPGRPPRMMVTLKPRISLA